MIEIKKNISLKGLNTFNIDVKAEKYCEINSVRDISELADSNSFDQKFMILGGGSNVLFTTDFNGLIIKNNLKGIKVISEDTKKVIVKAFAGEVWDDLVKFCVENEYYGIENLSHIPGTVGAAPIQNIGAYGTEISDLIKEVEYFDIFEKIIKIIDNSGCLFGYRNSIFKNELKNKILITAITIKLSKKKIFNLNYRVLAEEFKTANPDNLNIKLLRDKIIEIRDSKLPLTDQFGNAGSFFKNPEITKSEFKELHLKYPDIIFFETEENKMKIPAGWLIENAGLKGYRTGDVGTFPKQALVIVNYGNATGGEVIKFAEMIIGKIKKIYGINLIPEVNII
jgi:UDP-N-acetylmuramate dehydrogenase